MKAVSVKKNAESPDLDNLLISEYIENLFDPRIISESSDAFVILAYWTFYEPIGKRSGLRFRASRIPRVVKKIQDGQFISGDLENQLIMLSQKKLGYESF